MTLLLAATRRFWVLKSLNSPPKAWFAIEPCISVILRLDLARDSLNKSADVGPSLAAYGVFLREVATLVLTTELSRLAVDAFPSGWYDGGCASPSSTSTFVAVAADALSVEVFVAKHRSVVCRCEPLTWNGSFLYIGVHVDGEADGARKGRTGDGPARRRASPNRCARMTLCLC